jgi:hypothetical protein
MNEDQTQASNTSSGNTKIPITAITEYIAEIEKDSPQVTYGKTDATQVNKESVQVIDNIPKEENNAATMANRIAIFGVIINLVLGVFTYLLYKQAIKANEVANDSLITTQDAVKEAKRSNDISANALADSRRSDSISHISDSSYNSRNKEAFELTKQEFKARSKKDSITIDLTKQSVEAQINSINDANTKFELESTAFLQLQKFSINYFDEERRINIVAEMNNLGKYPAKTSRYRIGHRYDTIEYSTPSYKGIVFGDQIFRSDLSYIKEIPYFFQLSPKSPLTNEVYMGIKEGKYYIYITGEVWYSSSISGNERHYQFHYRIRQVSPTFLEEVPLSNENLDVK